MNRDLARKRFQRTSLLILLFAVFVSPIAFADMGDKINGWVVDILKFVPNFLADLLVGTGVDTENIYLPGSPVLFSFAQDNIFGIFTAKAYPVFKLIATIMVSPTIGFVAFDMLWGTTSQNKRDAFDKIRVLTFAVMAMWFLPDIVDLILGIKDQLVVAINNIFTGGTGSFVTSLGELAHSDSGSLLDAIIYLGAAIFGIWLMFNYLGLSFGFAVLFLYTPVALITTPAKFGKQVFGEITKDFAGFCLTPIIDITLLGIVGVIRSAASAETLQMNPIVYNLISIGLIMMVIPTRSKLKQKLGMGSALGDSLGAGLAVGTMAMMMRGAKRGKSNKGQSAAGGLNSGTDSNGLEEQANYYESLPKSESTSSGNDLGSDSSSNGTDESIENLDFADTKRGKLAREHMGKSYFNEDDIGGLSNQEKASVLRTQARDQRWDKRKNFAKDTAKGVLKGSVKAYGTAVGAGAGMFFGSKGMAMGAMAGNLVGGAVGKVPGAAIKAGKEGKELVNDIGHNVQLWRNKNNEDVVSVEPEDISIESGLSTDVEMGSANVNFEQEDVNVEGPDIDVKSASPNFNFASPETKNNYVEEEFVTNQINKKANKSINSFSSNLNTFSDDLKNRAKEETLKKIESEPIKVDEFVREHVQKVKTIERGIDSSIRVFNDGVRDVEAQIKQEISEKMKHSTDRDIAQMIKESEEQMNSRLLQVQSDALDVSEQEGLDLRKYMSNFIENTKID